MNYPIILLDADDTLLDFAASEAAALADMLVAQGLPNTPEVRHRYSEINTEHWKRLERGEITREELKISRFRQLLAELGSNADPAVCNDDYMARLGSYSILLPGAESPFGRIRPFALYPQGVYFRRNRRSKAFASVF